MHFSGVKPVLRSVETFEWRLRWNGAYSESMRKLKMSAKALYFPSEVILSYIFHIVEVFFAFSRLWTKRKTCTDVRETMRQAVMKERCARKTMMPQIIHTSTAVSGDVFTPAFTTNCCCREVPFSRLNHFLSNVFLSQLCEDTSTHLTPASALANLSCHPLSFPRCPAPADPVPKLDAVLQRVPPDESLPGDGRGPQPDQRLHTRRQAAAAGPHAATQPTAAAAGRAAQEAAAAVEAVEEAQSQLR